MPELLIATRICKNCFHGKAAKGADGTFDFSKRVCKAGPPGACVVGMNQAGPITMAFWPIVDCGQSCDAFQAKDARETHEAIKVAQ